MSKALPNQNPLEIVMRVDPTRDSLRAMWNIRVVGMCNINKVAYTANIQMSDFVIENAFNGDEAEALRVSMKQGVDAVLGKIFEKGQPKSKTFIFR